MNAIDLAEKFLPILDEIYAANSKTAILDSKIRVLDHSAANKVQIFKTSLTGLGDYDKATGFPIGKVTGTWEDVQLTKDRARAFVVDAMDDEESIGMAFGTLAGEFLRTQVVPEVDAYRFATWASASGVSKVSAGATLSSNNILAAIDAAALQLDNNDVPEEGRILFISSACYRALNAAISRTLSTERGAERRLQTLDEMTIIPVPQSRFYTSVTLNAGATETAGGYTKTASTGKDLNFILMHPSAVWQAKKHDKIKIFSPDVNQSADAWLFQYRLYHDAGVYENKAGGIYIHMKAE